MPDLIAAHGPPLVFYCQHSLGIGHLTRSFALAAALRQHFHVVFLNGGRLPPGLPVPQGIELIDLPPLGMDDGHTLVSRDTGHSDVGAALAQRRALIEAAIARHRPAVLLVELFPFGRKKFAGEILPMIRQVRRQPGCAAQVICSLRDILVDARPDQGRHDDRARWLTDRYFDAVVVHADPAFARLEESFHPTRPLRTGVHYSGYVVARRAAHAELPRGAHVLVSAGGGIVGGALYRCVLEARALLRAPPPLRIVAGPFLPESEWLALGERVSADHGVELVRQVGDMVAEMRRARASISQCGYNSALDIIGAGVPALVVPFETPSENEQRTRAQRLAALGAMQLLPAAELNSARLAQALVALLEFKPEPAALDLNGAQHTAHLLARWQARRAQEAA
ncbi:MAG: glycosyltransferase [Burkholderiaceae bacterium]